MTKILVAKEKHDIRIIDATDQEKAAAYLLKERIKDNWWYQGENKKDAKKALASGKSWDFLYKHRYGEYEWIEIIEVETPE